MARSFLILHGYQGSGPHHWQTWLADRLRRAGETVAYPELPSPSLPGRELWREALAEQLRALPPEPTVEAWCLGARGQLRPAADTGSGAKNGVDT